MNRFEQFTAEERVTLGLALTQQLHTDQQLAKLADDPRPFERHAAITKRLLDDLNAR